MNRVSGVSTQSPLTTISSEPLLSGFWIRWRSLTLSEQVVCANIVSIPLWWMSGLYRYMAVLLLIGIFYYNINTVGKIRLKEPSIAVLSLFAFASYRLFGGILYDMYEGSSINPTAMIRFISFWYGLVLLLWYIQSNAVRVRLTVVAWACSVSVAQMLLFWFVTRFILGEGPYTYPRTAFAILAGSGEVGYAEGGGLSNFLIPYRYKDQIFAGLSRWSFFFIIPEISALFSAFVALLALDLRNRWWSVSLFIGSLIILLLSGTRSVWLAIPAILGVRYFFSAGRRGGFGIPLAALALVSFITLSVPMVTDSITTTYEQSVTVVGEARADSTEVRGAIYRETLAQIPEKLFWGHWIAGRAVLPGFELGRVGTHSFILGTLLYRHGLVGTVLFLSFWISLALWFYQTRRSRPFCGFGLLLLYTLVSPVMEFGELIAWLLIVLSTITYSSVPSASPPTRVGLLPTRAS